MEVLNNTFNELDVAVIDHLFYGGVWYDENIFNEENSKYLQEFQERLNIQPFDSMDNAVQFMRNTTKKWFVITCGSRGEDFCKELKLHHINDDIDKPDPESIIGMFVFCGHVQKHRLWASNYRKIWDVVNSGFHEIFTKLCKLHDKYVTTLILSGTEDTNNDIRSVTGWIKYYTMGKSKDTQNRAVDYYEKNEVVSSKFLAISHMCMGWESINPAKVAEEIGNINKDAKTMYVTKLKATNDMLNAFVYVYGGNLLFKPFNELYAKQKYQKVMHITASALIELRKEKIKNPDSVFFVKPGTKLYRGVSREDVLKEYTNSQKGYWPSFSSTSTNESVAKGFAQEGGIIFELKLSTKNPHPHLKLPPNQYTPDGREHPSNWRQYPHEEEVLIFPYLAIKVVKITKDNGGYTRIYLEQDETQNVLAFDSERIQQYLKPIINDKVLPPVKIHMENIVKEIQSLPLNLTEFMITKMLTSIGKPTHVARLPNKTLFGNTGQAIQIAADDYLSEKEVQLSSKYPNSKDLLQIIFTQLKFSKLLKNAENFKQLHSDISNCISYNMNNASTLVDKISSATRQKAYQDEQRFWLECLDNIKSVLLEMVKNQFY